MALYHSQTWRHVIIVGWEEAAELSSFYIKRIKFPFKIYLFLRLFSINTNNYLCALSYDVASGSEITPCNKIDQPLVVYIFFYKLYNENETLK